MIAAVLVAIVGATSQQSLAHDDCGCPQEQESQVEWKLFGYAGASLGYDTFSSWRITEDANDGSYSGASSDDSDMGFRVHAGLNLLEHVAVELGYTDYGEASFAAQSDGSGAIWNPGPIRESVAAEGLDLTLLGRWQAGSDLALTGRVGLLRWSVDGALSGDHQTLGPIDLEASDDGEALLLGVALEYDGLRPVRLALGYSYAELSAQMPQEDIELGSAALTASYLFDGQ